jgi:branched-subunit amino acid transport protein
MAINIVLAILVTSLATYISRFLGVITSKKVKENSKIFKWFNCLAYSTLSALLARIIIFPAGVLSDASYTSRITVVIFSLFIFFISNKNYVYPTVLSAIVMALLTNYL